MPNASDETSIEVLGRLVGQQRRDADDTRGAVRALTQRVNSLDLVMGSKFGGMERAMDRTHKAVAALHINNRLATTSAELSGHQRFLRHAVLHVLKRHGDDLPTTWVRHYGSRGQREELAEGAVPIIRGSKEELLHRATTDPAKIAVPAWAGDLAAVDLANFMVETSRASIFARLSELGTQLESANASIVVPQIPATPSGSFIGEALPIPAYAATLTNAVLAPRKVGLLAAYSNDIRDLSLPSIESVLEFLLAENLRRVIDAALIDTLPATAIRPAGLRNGVAALPSSVVTDPLTAMIADVKTLTNAIIQAGGSEPVFILAPTQAVWLTMAIGTPPSAIISANVPAGLVICVDAASFVSSLGAPRLSISSESSLHMETIPAPLVTGGVVATPARSLLQTDTSSLRLLFDVSWQLAGGLPKRVAWMIVSSW